MDKYLPLAQKKKKKKKKTHTQRKEKKNATPLFDEVRNKVSTVQRLEAKKTRGWVFGTIESANYLRLLFVVSLHFFKTRKLNINDR